MKTKTIFIVLTGGVILISGILAITGVLTGTEFIASVGTLGGIIFGLYQQYDKVEKVSNLENAINHQEELIENLKYNTSQWKKANNNLTTQIAILKAKTNESKEETTKSNKKSRK